MPNGCLGGSSAHWLAGLIAGFGIAFANAAEADDDLRFRWYRIEVILFENSPSLQPGSASGNPSQEKASASVGEDPAARPRLLDTLRLPRNAMSLVEPAPSNAATAVGAPLAVEQTWPLVVSNLPPPVWFAGICAAASWQAPAEAAFAFDPCLPRNDVDLEAEFRDDPLAGLPPTPTELAAANELASPTALAESFEDETLAALVDDQAQRQAALDALRDYEDDLLMSSYVWQREMPLLDSELRRLRRRVAVLAAGSWHQPVPARHQAQPLLMTLGTADAEQRFGLEGWFSVTLGRYLHFETQLQYRLAEDRVAVLSERRRLRQGETHYLDHPALGILVRAAPLRPPNELLQPLAVVTAGENSPR